MRARRKGKFFIRHEKKWEERERREKANEIRGREGKKGEMESRNEKKGSSTSSDSNSEQQPDQSLNRRDSLLFSSLHICMYARVYISMYVCCTCMRVCGSTTVQRPCVFAVYRGEKGECGCEMVVCTPRGV